MPGRRSVLAGLLAAGFLPRPGWAAAGDPAYLAAAATPAGDYRLCGLDETGEILFDLPLPARGHAAAAHPARPEAVAFARRPGRFALVIDCAEGRETARLTAPPGRHFYGHGAFSPDGKRLYTTENDYDAARGMVGIWDAGRGYARVGEVPSGGVGPHEIRLMPDGATLVVANGGIETHPETGRTKLNIPMMRPNLAYLSLDGEMLEVAEPPRELHKNSIRHLDLRADGLVAAGCQWQGDLADAAPLFVTHRRGGALEVLGGGEPARQLQGYVGSVAFSGDGETVALTGPRGGAALLFSVDGALRGTVAEPDIAGVARARDGLLFTTGTGLVRTAAGVTARHPVLWDNHLVGLA